MTNPPILGDNVIDNVSRNINKDAISKRTSLDTSDEQEDDSPWHTVSPRRARSLDSAELAARAPKKGGQAPRTKNSDLSAEPNVEAEAMKALADKQNHQQKKTRHHRRESSVESQVGLRLLSQACVGCRGLSWAK